LLVDPLPGKRKPEAAVFVEDFGGGFAGKQLVIELGIVADDIPRIVM
jgi:hypothetical protein